MMYYPTLQNRHSYATLVQLKDPGWLNITDAVSDATLLSLLEESSKRCDRACNRFFYLCNDTRYFDGKASVIILDDDLYQLIAMNVDPTGSGQYSLSYSATNTPADIFLYPLNRTPTTTIEVNWNGQYGTFYAGFRHNIQIQGVWGHGPDVYNNAFEDSGISASLTADQTNAFTGKFPITFWSPTAWYTLQLSGGKSGKLAAGMTIMVDQEMMYVLQVYYQSDTVLLQRATMGTMLDSHSSAEIYVAQYPADVNRACLIIAKDEYNKRLSSGGSVGNAVTGTDKAPLGNEADGLLKPYKRERVATWVGD
jgi:hypothetical protein